MLGERHEWVVSFVVSNESSHVSVLHAIAICGVLAELLRSVSLVALQNAFQECLIRFGSDDSVGREVRMPVSLCFFRIQGADAVDFLVICQCLGCKLAAVCGVVRFYLWSVRLCLAEMLEVVNSLDRLGGAFLLRLFRISCLLEVSGHLKFPLLFIVISFFSPCIDIHSVEQQITVR
jgi:hypothetical protein